MALATALGLGNRLHAQSKLTPREAPAVQGDTQLHGQKLAGALCAPCHGSDGNSKDAQYPKIAGQNEAYLLAQLRAFKNGRRKSDFMSGPTSALSESQMAELARFYSRQAIAADPVGDARLAAVGARIFNYPSLGRPPCATCHGPRRLGTTGPMMGRQGGMSGHMGMMGNAAPTPNLNGQHADYILRQLKAYAAGTRKDPVMRPIAAALSAENRKAVAQYLSGLR